METISSSSSIRGSVESLIGGRAENQDSYGMSEIRLGMLFVVCDGMGGGPAGKTASSIATQSIIDYVSGASPEQNPLSVLTDAVVSANEALLAAVAQNPALKGMGTTCVGVLICKKNAYVVHVGDSRVYQIRGNNMVFRTADHSYVGELVRRGTMSEEEARNSKYSNVITRALGAAPEISPEVQEVSFKPGDRFALMTDGIWGSMPEPALIKLLSEKYQPAELVPEIAAHVDAIGRQKGGGHDNLTIAIVDIPGRRATINDTAAERFNKSAKEITGSLHPVNHTEDDTYQLEEIHEELDRNVDHYNKWKGVLIWALGISVAVCVAIIIYLLATPKLQSVPVSESGENMDHIKEKLAQIQQIQQPQEQKQPQEVKSHLMIALGQLKNLRDYKPAKDDHSDHKNIRTKLFNNVVKQLNEAYSVCKDDATKDKIDELLQYLEKNKNGIIYVDPTWHHPTKDGLKFLDHCIEILKPYAQQ